MTKVVSFDVGVKNFAYCVCSIEKMNDELNGVTDEATGVTVVTGVKKEKKGKKEEAKKCSLQIHDWDVIAIVPLLEKVPALDVIAKGMFTALDDIVERNPDISVVLIENQPCMRNPTMKSVQMLLYSYWAMDNHMTGSNIAIHHISANQKLKQPADLLSEAPVCTKTGYAKNKWLAVQYATAYCKGDGELSGKLASSRKRDDLSDCLLQAISWLRRGGDDVTGCHRCISATV